MKFFETRVEKFKFLETLERVSLSFSMHLDLLLLEGRGPFKRTKEEVEPGSRIKTELKVERLCQQIEKAYEYADQSKHEFHEL